MFRDITDTKVIDLFGAQFFLKTIDERTFKRLSIPITDTVKASEGQDSQEVAIKNADALYDAFYDLVRHGVMGHANMKKKDGTVIEFKKSTDGLVDDEMMRLYSINRLISNLGSEVFIYNHIGDEERKN